jgi:hypothetical protein
MARTSATVGHSSSRSFPPLVTSELAAKSSLLQTVSLRASPILLAPRVLSCYNDTAATSRRKCQRALPVYQLKSSRRTLAAGPRSLSLVSDSFPAPAISEFRLPLRL